MAGRTVPACMVKSAPGLGDGLKPGPSVADHFLSLSEIAGRAHQSAKLPAGDNLVLGQWIEHAAKVPAGRGMLCRPSRER